MNAQNTDRAFAIYAFALIAGILLLLTATVQAGISSAPPLGYLVEHVALGLMVRCGYKSLDGSNWVRDFLEYTGMIVTPREETVAGGFASAA